MGAEEQAEEREVLASIYPDEIHEISPTEFRISIALDSGRHEDDETEDPVLILNVKYPEEYPDVAPVLDITQPPNTSKHEHLDIQDDKYRLLESLQETIEENLGIQMVFTLVSTLKDAAEQLMAERQSEVQAEMDAAKAKAEEEENRKFEGEKVTRESFLKWSEGYKKELEAEKQRAAEVQEAEDKKKRGPKEEKKLTGRQLWEMGMAGKVMDEEDDEGEDIDVDRMKGLSVEG